MKKKENTLFMIVVIICVISIVMMIAALAVTNKNNEKAAFIPPPFEENAVQGVPEVAKDSGWGEVDVGVYKALICGRVALKDGKANLWFTNPDSNKVWLKLRVLDKDGNILGETGIIKPGEYVQSVVFTSIPNEGDKIELKLMAYEPETYYSAGSITLNTVAMEGDT